MNLASVTGILFVIFVATEAIHPNVAQSSFCYDDPSCGPSTWGGICKSGQEQSPINIDLTNEPSEWRRTEFLMDTHYLREVTYEFYAQNNGHTAQFELSSNASNLHSNLRICGGGLGSCYKFAQFHFHWDEADWDGSEHTIDGQRFPMELHIVHYKEKFTSLAKALGSSDRDAVAVMGIFFEISDEDNKNLDSIIRVVDKLRVPSEIHKFHLPLSIVDIYPEGGASRFVRYNGSLTTPTCDEKVVWTVFLETLPISEAQISRFRAVRNAEGASDFNFRPIQPTNGRELLFYREGRFREILPKDNRRWHG